MNKDDLSKVADLREISEGELLEREKRKKIKFFKENIVTPYINNSFQAMRTAGALLLGNSALVYYEVIGKNGANFWSLIILGVSLILISSWPFGVKLNKEK